MAGENEFDMSGALDEISSGLGFGEAVAEDTSSEDSTGDSGLDQALDSTVESPAPEDATSTEPSAPTASSSTAPRTWRQEAAAEWAKVPPAVQVEVLKREEDMFRGLEGYKADASFGKVVKGVIDPYMPILNQYGLDPVQQVQSLMAAHYKLALGTPDEKAAMFYKLAQDYGIEVGGQQETPYEDPAVKALRTELNSLQSSLKARETREVQETRQKINTEIQAFATDPAHSYFDEVANDVAALIRSGVATTLQEAYDKAVWTNPVTRAKEQARLVAAQTAKAKKEAEEKAAAARKATAATVRPKAKAVSGTTPLGSMDKTMQDTLAAIRSRA